MLRGHSLLALAREVKPRTDVDAGTDSGGSTSSENDTDVSTDSEPKLRAREHFNTCQRHALNHMALALGPLYDALYDIDLEAPEDKYISPLALYDEIVVRPDPLISISIMVIMLTRSPGHAQSASQVW